MDKFEQFCSLLLKYNQIHRVSGVKNSEDIYKNIEDSLYPINFIDFSKIKKVVDIGTGAGFPGLILAIEFRDIEFSLVEPISKRRSFLYLVKSVYGLQNIDIIDSRIEDVKAFKVDLITSRAVARSSFLLSLAKDFIADRTQILFYKGQKVFDEVDENMKYEIINRGTRNYLWIKGFKDV